MPMASAPASTTQRRIFGALLFLPVIGLFLASQTVAQWLLVIIAMAMAWELASMLGMPLALRVGLLFDMLLFALPAPLIAEMEVLAGFSLLPVFLVLAALFAIFVWMVTAKRLAALFAALLLGCILSARDILGFQDGHITLLSMAAVIAACDIAAYFVGRRVGGPPLAPVISPKKTRSGAIGGLVAAVLVMMALSGQMSLSLSEALIGGAVIAVLAQSGDLLESALKRKLAVKDSGSLIPGHGGFLDRFDGYLLTLPALYMYMM